MLRHFVGCDMTETITGREAGGGYLNSATVTYALKDLAGTTLAGGTGSYTYTPDSDGDYTATIQSTVTAIETPGEVYELVVTVVSGSYNDTRYLKRVAEKRGGD